jgi:ribonuclease T2
MNASTISSPRPALLRMVLSLAAILVVLCGVTPGRPQAPSLLRVAQPAPAASSSYDYYILTLSWSPEFCLTHSDNPQCVSHPGFVVHGLWPERNDGSYPQNCGNAPGPTSDAVWSGILPTRALAMHEWQTHGTCTPYDADSYFKLVRQAWQSVKIPEEFTAAAPPPMQPPAQIIEAFARINLNMPAGAIVLSCGNNHLTAMEICFDKKLQPIACAGIRTCHANAVKITPR